MCPSFVAGGGAPGITPGTMQKAIDPAIGKGVRVPVFFATWTLHLCVPICWRENHTRYPACPVNRAHTLHLPAYSFIRIAHGRLSKSPFICTPCRSWGTLRGRYRQMGRGGCEVSRKGATWGGRCLYILVFVYPHLVLWGLFTCTPAFSTFFIPSLGPLSPQVRRHPRSPRARAYQTCSKIEAPRGGIPLSRSYPPCFEK